MDRAALAAAAVGGYVLGRTKKGKAVIRLAMLLSGQTPQQRVMALAQQATSQLGQTEEISKLTEQLRGPLMEAVQKAAVEAISARAGSLSKSLADRTSSASEATSQTLNELKNLAPTGSSDDEEEGDDSEDDEPEEKPAKKVAKKTAKKSPKKGAAS